ncbi:MAG: ComEA family DNA-binding protein [Candidatus Omnitrophota bacterium]
MTMTSFKKYVSVLIVVMVLAMFATDGYGATKIKLSPDGKSPAVININTAGVDELTRLPRVGEKMARRIIECREKNGKFKKPQDLMKVKGIGEKSFKKLEKMITI